MRTISFIGMALLISLSACQKETPNTPIPNVSLPIYYPLTHGSYWIYENVIIDSMGNVTTLPIIDSMVVTNDTVINGKTYQVFRGTDYPITQQFGITKIARDSSGYIVNPDGYIYGAFHRYHKVLDSTFMIHNHDTLYSLSYTLEKPELPLTTTAGTFNVVNYQGKLVMSNPPANVPRERMLNNYYSPNVGLVAHSYFYLHASSVSEKRLLRYHINP